MNSSIYDKTFEKLEQIERGKRIKLIRETELYMSKSELAKEIGVSGQFLGLVEDGKGNLVYLSGHSADYILYGLDDNIIKETSKYLKEYSESQIIQALEVIKSITSLINKL